MIPIDDKRFTAVRLREGYSMADVDAFLDKIQTLPLASRADAVRDARFASVYWREGYDMAEVDDYLDELVAHYCQENETAAVSQALRSDSAALSSDAQALRSDWESLGMGEWSTTITTEPFMALSPQAVAQWEKLAADTLAVVPTAKERELAEALRDSLEAYQALLAAVDTLEGVNVSTVGKNA